MTSLSTWSFATKEGAVLGLRAVERLQVGGGVQIEDSAVVTWAPEDRRPTGYQVGCADGAAALSGAFWGLLFSIAYLVPLAGITGATWPADGLSRIGLTDATLRHLRGRLHPDGSALFVVSDDAGRRRLQTALRCAVHPPATDCHVVTLDSTQSDLLRSAFAAEDSYF